MTQFTATTVTIFYVAGDDYLYGDIGDDTTIDNIYDQVIENNEGFVGYFKNED